MTRHDADEVLGHLQHHHTKHGAVIRFHRRHLPPPPAEPPMESFVAALGVWLLLVASLYILVAVAAAYGAAQR